MTILHVCGAVALLLLLGCSGGAALPTSSGSDSSSGSTALTPSVCDEPDLVWQTANKTSYEFHAGAGQLAACTGTRSGDWVRAHDIASVFPDANSLALHRLCLKAASKTLVVNVLDACNDTDASGRCARNRGSAELLIDLERSTDERFGVADGPISWADLGQLPGEICD